MSKAARNKGILTRSLIPGIIPEIKKGRYKIMKNRLAREFRNLCSEFNVAQNDELLEIVCNIGIKNVYPELFTGYEFSREFFDDHKNQLIDFLDTYKYSNGEPDEFSLVSGLNYELQLTRENFNLTLEGAENNQEDEVKYAIFKIALEEYIYLELINYFDQ